MKPRTLILIVAALSAVLAFAAEFSPPASDGANETVTVKKRLRVSEVTINRGASIVFSTERVSINDTTGADVTVNKGPEVNRQVSAVLAETVTVAGQQVTLQQALNILGKFYEKWKAEDEAAAAAAAARVTTFPSASGPHLTSESIGPALAQSPLLALAERMR